MMLPTSGFPDIMRIAASFVLLLHSFWLCMLSKTVLFQKFIQRSVGERRVQGDFGYQGYWLFEERSWQEDHHRVVLLSLRSLVFYWKLTMLIIMRSYWQQNILMLISVPWKYMFLNPNHSSLFVTLISMIL